MNGLDAILDRIRTEAEALAAEKAQECAQALRELAVQTAETEDRIRAEVRAQSDADLAALARRTASTLSLDARRIRLDAHQRLVAEAIEGAIAHLASRPAAERKALYLGWLDEAAQGGETVSFPADDLDGGLARSVLDEADRRLAARTPGAAPLVLSPEPSGTRNGGGIVLSRNDIETNLTFDMIVRQHREELESLAASLVLDAGRDDGR